MTRHQWLRLQDHLRASEPSAKVIRCNGGRYIEGFDDADYRDVVATQPDPDDIWDLPLAPERCYER